MITRIAKTPQTLQDQDKQQAEQINGWRKAT